MGEQRVEAAGTVVLDSDSRGALAQADVVGATERASAPRPRSARRRSRRRFVRAVTIATAVVAVPYCWVLWSLWGPVHPLRQTNLEDNFYDLQARAMFHGHLWVPKGSIGIEAFFHDGRTYTYFGLFPSIIRMPILLVTSRLDGRLTAPSMLVAWLLTAVFAAMLLWRVRILVRGDAVMGRAEATSMGVLMATIMGGSVLLYLAASPYVFSEDLAWSVCLTVGSLFALLGVIERPSWGRVVASGILILCANIDRATTGWACAIAAVLVAVWLALGRGGPENRRWSAPVLVAGLVPLLVAVGVNMLKFGIPFGVPVSHQLFTLENAYRRRFLAANHNSEVGLAFVPSNLVAYLQPFGLRIGSTFPYITLPATPAHALGGVLFDKRYRTDSLPPSTPLLFLLSCWGLITAFRPRPPGRTAATRLLLLAAGGAAAALLLWGYIAPRYLADFMPLLILASAVGMVDVWRRLDGRRRNVRLWALLVIAVLGVYSVVANIGVSITPNEEWTGALVDYVPGTTTQTLSFVQTAQDFSKVTGNQLRATVRQGPTLPTYGPGDQLFIVGDCAGLYVSNGENYANVPNQQFQRFTWMVVQRGPAFQHSFRITFRRPQPGQIESADLVYLGSHADVAVSAEPARRPGLVRVTFGLYGDGRRVYGISTYVRSGTTHDAVVVTDPAKRLVTAGLDGQVSLPADVVVPQPITAVSRGASPGSRPAVVVTNTTGTALPALCRSLLPNRHGS